ncbi:hypothetical protein X802_07760 [Thermococcus guaymasensis DSM 11113]|uniref:Condensin complex subunit 1 C-terminal domain-containing protein n=1 Tax=Thermococcus guaymasensis DSM 11113 TaxID=1432656 RepID=A0A0X1KLC3_9EURY|nr:hypothetical protein [Thermococcus guaymasensis]AJC72069.1 hypothetical protein X802_07760 [Thermococcus guaymasensis DSM 11113]
MSCDIEVLREYLGSWEIKKAIELAQENDECLQMLFKFLHDRDDHIKIRTLLALREVLEVLPNVKKLILVKKFLDDLLRLLKSDNDNLVIHAIRTIGKLIEGVPLPPEKFIKVVRAFTDLLKSGKNEFILIEIPAVLNGMKATSYPPRLMDVVSGLLRENNPRLKAIGLRLLLTIGAHSKSPSILKTLFSEITEILSSESKNDFPLVEFVLDILLEIPNYSMEEELIDEVARVLTAVKNLALREKLILREKAKMVAERLELAIHDYYAQNPEKAKEKIHELLINERFYEAIDLALAVGDTYVLKWLTDVLEKFGKETLKINERVLPGPKYVSVPPEKKAQRYLRLPTLSQFRGTKRSAMRIKLNESASWHRLSEQEPADLEETIKTGNEETLLEVPEKNIKAVLELVNRLKNGGNFEKMDALWALSKIAEQIGPEMADILEPAIGELLKLAHSKKNKWMRQRASKTLAIFASKSREGSKIVRQFLEDYLSGDMERVVPALEFFSYYFERVWDEKTARVILSRLKDYLKTEETRFDALLTLKGIVGLAPPEKAGLFAPFVEVLKEIRESAPPQDKKLAIRILEEIALKVKAWQNEEELDET